MPSNGIRATPQAMYDAAWKKKHTFLETIAALALCHCVE
jgi:hypothetical protein